MKTKIGFITFLCLFGCQARKSNKNAQLPVQTEAPQKATQPIWEKDSAGLPINPFLADSPWPISHRHPYSQGSSPLAGPENEKLNSSLTPKSILPVSVTLAVSGLYKTGTTPTTNERVIWGCSLRQVFKLNYPSGEVLDSTERIPESGSLSGAYTFVDSDNDFYAPNGMSIEKFGDQNSIRSKIQKIGSLKIASTDVQKDEHIVGMNLSFQGDIITVTNLGLVSRISRDFQRQNSFRLFSSGQNEDVSNSISLDERGHLFVISSLNVYSVDIQTSDIPRIIWIHKNYPTSTGELPFGRLGHGSGTTPSLMGAEGEDELLVFADGQKKMHVWFLWRNEIPSDFKPSLPEDERRIAGHVPITFGLENTSDVSFITEQSLLVAKYGVGVVSNTYGRSVKFLESIFIDARARNTNRVLSESEKIVSISNFSDVAPRGVEKISWNPVLKRVEHVNVANPSPGSSWQNPDIRCPNGIPTMSHVSGLFYCIGTYIKDPSKVSFLPQKNPWTLEALDWQTGKLRFRYYLGQNSNGQKSQSLEAREHLIEFNSMYAATQLIFSGGIASGMIGGVGIFSP